MVYTTIHRATPMPGSTQKKKKMKTPVRLALFVLVLSAILLAACAPIGRVFSTISSSLPQNAEEMPLPAATDATVDSVCPQFSLPNGRLLRMEPQRPRLLASRRATPPCQTHPSRSRQAA